MLEAGEVVDRYTVESVLGEGGMAVVYRVRHNQLDSLHALKILTITNPSVKDRLLQEGKVQASLRHPNIVAVTDVLEVRDAPGLVMEFIEGPGLDEWLHQHERTVEESVALFEAICLGVAHAHAKGVIHRDLKPANVMMAPASGMWMPKVADFGLAKAVTEDGSMQKTRSGVTMGTPQYMAPEQIRDAKSVDERADVFSLGCILYELVCGRPPFNGPDILSIFNAVASGSFPAAVSLVPDLPPRVRDAIEGSLVVDRERRLGSVNELIEVLRGAPLPAPAAQASQERTHSGGGQRTWAPEAGVAPAVTIGQQLPRRDAVSTGTIDPGSAPSLPEGGQKKRGWGRVLAVGVVGLVLLGGLGVAGVAGGAWFARNAVESSVSSALADHGGLSATDVSLGPRGLMLTNFEVQGPDGQAALRAESLRLVAKPTAFRGSSWGVDRIVVSGLSGDLRRGMDGRFHLAGAAESALREGAPFALSAPVVIIEEGTVELSNAEGPLTVEWEKAELQDFRVDLRSGLLWSADGARLSSLDVGAADPLLRIASLEVTEGRAEAEGLELWVRGRTDGMLDLPPVVNDEIADWAGGTRHKAETRPWLGIDVSGLPVQLTEFVASSGTLHLTERVHGVKTASWDVGLERFSIGPMADDRLPIGVSGSMGDGRITLDGDVSSDGLLRLALAARYLPVDAFSAYIKPSLDRYQVQPDSGTVDLAVALTVQRNTFAAALDVSGAKIAFSKDGKPGRRAQRLLTERAKVEESSFIEGNLADQGFAPFGDAVGEVRDLLFAPAGGGVVDAAKRAERERIREQKEAELAEARAAAAGEADEATAVAPKTEPAVEPEDPTTGGGGRDGEPQADPETAADPTEEAAAEEEEKKDAKEAFQRVNRGVRDALDDFRIRRR